MQYGASKTMQAKPAQGSPSRRPPAPPVFRPGIQASIQPASVRTIPPPVYRPLFANVAPLLAAPTFRPSAPASAQMKPGSTLAPPVYRPTSPPVSSFSAASLQMRRGPGSAPPVYRPVPGLLAQSVSVQKKPAPTPKIFQRPNLALPRPSVAQPKINYETSYQRRTAKDLSHLTKQLVTKFGAPNRSVIERDLAVMVEDGEVWSMMDVWQYFARKLRVQREVTFGGGSRGRYPNPVHSCSNYCFNSVTYLTGMAGGIPFDSRNISDTETVSGEHAEEVFMRQVEGDDRVTLSTNPRVVLTINNSPCDAKCAALLAAWVTRRGLTDVSVYFSNPHGTREQVGSAIRTLRAAGIRVHSLPVERLFPRKEITARGTKMTTRLTDAREEKWYNSDPESEDELTKGRSSAKRKHDSAPSSSRDQGRDGPASSSAKKKPVSVKRARVVPRDIEGVGTLHNVIGNNMDCLIRSLLIAAGHADGDVLVGELREFLVSRGVTGHGQMLNLVNTQGALLLSEMVRRHLINVNRGLRVYTFGNDGAFTVHTIQGGPNPISIWLSDDHFQAIVPAA
jgi:Secreted Novel AID/APOBEC-like Deaminase 4